MTSRTWAMVSASTLATLLVAPAMAQTSPQTAAPVPAQATPAQAVDEAVQVDEIVVTGFRRSLQSAQQIKRNADQIVDSIVAEDIGKLPDATASDSLARITGVQVERAGGEAGRVLVRGLPDLTTTYNGRDIFTAEARSVAIQDYPAGGVAALDVFKSTTADQVEGGIAGLINVRSRRPFDFEGLEIAGGLRGTYADQSGETNLNGNLLLSDRWDTGVGEIGALINVSYTELTYLDSARFVGGGFIDAVEAGQTTQAEAIGARFSDGVGIFYGVGDRSRPSVNAALQWRPTDEVELYADFLYQGFRSEIADRQLFVPLYGDATFSNIVLQPDGDRVRSLTSTGQVRPELVQNAAENQTDTYQVAIGGSWERGPLRITADLAATDSRYESSITNLDTAFAISPTVDVDFDVADDDGGVAFGFPSFDAEDPANVLYRGFFDRRLVAEGSDIQFRTDGTWDTGQNGITQLQFGFRYVDRDAAFRNGERYTNLEGLGLTLAQGPVSYAVIDGGFRHSDVQPTRTWVSPTYDGIRDSVGALRTLAGFPAGEPPFDAFSTFDANEISYAAYVQARFELNTPMPVDGVIGLRAVRTEETLAGNQRQFVEGGPTVFSPVTSENDYVDFLPSVSARIHLTERLQLRLTANQTRTRPGFAQLNPALSIDPNPIPGTTIFNAGGGNVDLEPVRSTNYDASLEYYFSNTGTLAVAVFQRDIQGFIENQTVDTTANGRTLRLNRPVNLNDTTLSGVEAGFTTFLDFDGVPEWMHGFGVQLNGTYIDDDGTLNGISEFAYNVIGIYEQGPISTRLAWNSRDPFRNGCNLAPSFNPGCEYTEAVGRLDFAFNYTPVENITVTFDASNILGTPFRSYREYFDANNAVEGRFPRDVRFEETIYSLGVRFRY